MKGMNIPVGVGLARRKESAGECMRIRFFGYVPDTVGNGEQKANNEVEIEHGHGYEEFNRELVTKAYNCPRCKRVLFEADVSLHGVIFIKCRRCKRKVAIKTTPIMDRIGFW